MQTKQKRKHTKEEDAGTSSSFFVVISFFGDDYAFLYLLYIK